MTKTFTATTRIPATGLSISQESATVEVGDTLQLTATIEPSNTTDEITWTTSEPTVASITTDATKKVATITGLKGGTSTITVTCGSLTKTCTVTAERFSGLNTGNSNPEGALPSGDITVIESDASKGIVIKDKNDREWVWIQVPKTTVFTTATSSTDYTNIKNDLITYAGVYRKGSASQTYSWDDTWYSGCGIADATTYNTMYNKMLKSVYTNGGFWIQRHEDGRKDISCSTAQGYASGFSPDGIKTSSLLFGIQWDLVCKYLEGKDGLTTENINSDSKSWGVYSTSSPSGNQERNKKMNIYDFAGNFAEFTLENAMATKDFPCACRGGSFYRYGSDFTAASRGENNINNGHKTMIGSDIAVGSGVDSFRATFY